LARIARTTGETGRARHQGLSQDSTTWYCWHTNASENDRHGGGHAHRASADHAVAVRGERFSAGATATTANPTSGLVILRIPHPACQNHVGGQLAFGPDGYLYLGTGDGGGAGAGDPQGNARNPASLLGKLLRIDVVGATAAQPYAIPASNPYRDMAGRRPEIWAVGLRNPWRFSFDASQLYLPDPGQDRREEINIAGTAQAGLDYGWNVMEGTLCYGAETCERSGLTLPVFEYDHGANDVNGCSITGGFVYRGRALPELAGRYFYSDLCGGYLKSFLATGNGAGNGIIEQRDWERNSSPITGV